MLRIWANEFGLCLGEVTECAAQAGARDVEAIGSRRSSHGRAEVSYRQCCGEYHVRGLVLDAPVGELAAQAGGRCGILEGAAVVLLRLICAGLLDGTRRMTTGRNESAGGRGVWRPTTGRNEWAGVCLCGQGRRVLESREWVACVIFGPA